MSAAAVISLGLRASIFLFVLVLGLRASLRDATYLLHTPRLLATSLISMNVVMPVLAVWLVLAFDLKPPVQIALVTLSVSPVPPFLPLKELKAGGRSEYTIGLLVATAVLSIVVIPIALEICQRILHIELSTPFSAIVTLVLSTVLIPLAAGLAIRAALPRFADRVDRALGIVAIVLLLLCVVVVLVVQARAMWSLVGDGTLAVLVLFSVAGLVVGHLLGGPVPADRPVLALSTSARHPAVAAAIAHASFPQQKLSLSAVLLALIVSIVVSAVYLAWLRRRRPQQPPREANANGRRRAA